MTCPWACQHMTPSTAIDRKIGNSYFRKFGFSEIWIFGNSDFWKIRFLEKKEFLNRIFGKSDFYKIRFLSVMTCPWACQHMTPSSAVGFSENQNF